MISDGGLKLGQLRNGNCIQDAWSQPFLHSYSSMYVAIEVHAANQFA